MKEIILRTAEKSHSLEDLANNLGADIRTIKKILGDEFNEVRKRISRNHGLKPERRIVRRIYKKSEW